MHEEMLTDVQYEIVNTWDLKIYNILKSTFKKG